MLTINSLKDYGADVQSGLRRCANKEVLYLKLVAKVPGSDDFKGLKKALDDGDHKKAFEYAHALKGILSNLSLTPLLEPVVELTELLRADASADYTEYTDIIERQRRKLQNICES